MSSALFACGSSTIRYLASCGYSKEGSSANTSGERQLWSGNSFGTPTREFSGESPAELVRPEFLMEVENPTMHFVATKGVRMKDHHSGNNRGLQGNDYKRLYGGRCSDDKQ